MVARMARLPLVSNDRQARDADAVVAELDRALSSDQALAAIVSGLPPQVVSGVRRSLATERRELLQALRTYREARAGNFDALREQTGNDPGLFLISARLMRGLSQKDLGRRLGLKEQAIQRWEVDRYRSVSLSNFQKVAEALGVSWRFEMGGRPAHEWGFTYDVARDDLMKVVRHARANGWLKTSSENDDESAIATLVRYVGDHVVRYGTPSLLRTGLRTNDRPDNWMLLSWKAQVTRRAEKIIESRLPKYRPAQYSWLMELVRLSQHDDGPSRAKEFLLDRGIVLIAEPQISGMSIDGASFLIDETPIIGLTLLRDTADNFWFTLLHEVAHIVLHYRTGLATGFFDDLTSSDVDEFEVEANAFAQNLLIPDEIWARSPARISKSPEPIERLATQLKISSAIVFGRIRMERNDYSLFADRIGRGTVRRQLSPCSEETK